MNGTAAKAAVPFSYAQAARGKLSPSSSSGPAPQKTPESSANTVKSSNSKPSASTSDSLPTSSKADATLQAPQSGALSASSGSLSHNSSITENNPPSGSAISKITPPDESCFEKSSAISPLKSTSDPSQLPDSVNVDLLSTDDPSPTKSSDAPSPTASLSSSAEPSAKSSEINRETTTGFLKEAPIPTVNVWKRRAEELKAKASSAASSISVPTSSSAVVSSTDSGSTTDLSTIANKSEISKFPNDSNHDIAHRKKNRSSHHRTDSSDQSTFERSKPSRGKHDYRHPHRRDNIDSESGRERPSHSHSNSASGKVAGAALPLPVEDETLWPTPESAQDEKKRKLQERNDKSDKERYNSTSGKSHGKSEWIHMPYTPSVVWSTPLPGNSRRGGRNGRGTKDNVGRSSHVNGSSKNDVSTRSTSDRHKDRSGPNPVKDGYQPKDSHTSGDVTYSKNSKKGSFVSSPDDDSHQTKSSSGGSDNAGYTRDGSTSHRGGHNRPSSYSKGRPNRRNDVSASSSKPSSGEEANKEKASSCDEPRSSSTGNRNESGDLGFLQAKPGFFERRHGHFHTLGSREGRGRGGSRGGRGGRHAPASFFPGHLSNHQYTSTHLKSPSPFGYPRSPSYSFFDGHNPYFATLPRTFRGPNGRVQSIPPNDIYRVPNGLPNSGHMFSSIPGSFGGVYDYSGFSPMGAMSYCPYYDLYTLFGSVSNQLDYYFSVDNLCKDLFLRKHMDSKGFVFLTVIADFNRMKCLTSDLELIKLACFQSKVIEYRVGADGVDLLRARNGWEQWVLNMNERDPSAQNDGPNESELQIPPVPQPIGFEPYFALPYPFPTFPFQMPPSGPILPCSNVMSLNGIVPSGGRNYLDFFNGDVNATPLPPAGSQSNGGKSSKSAISNKSTQSGRSCDEPDSFLDDQIPDLSVIVRKQVGAPSPKEDDGSASSLHESAVNFVNDSVNETVNSVQNIEASSNGRVSHKSGTVDNCLNEFETCDIRDNEKSVTTAGAVSLFWVQGLSIPVESLPQNSTYLSYLQLRQKALALRDTLMSPGTCPYETLVLYQFWSDFLVRNFNTSMYLDFRQNAHEDVRYRFSLVGFQCLLRFYYRASLSETLLRRIIAEDFVNVIRNERFIGLPGLRQLKGLLNDTSLSSSNRARLEEFIDSDVEMWLSQVE